MALEYVIYADESSKRGRFYSNFYGGALVRSTDLAPVQATLEAAKAQLNLHGEVKWSKVTSQYLEKYKKLMSVFFGLVRQDRVKVRIMFTQNAQVPVGLDVYHQENEFFLLYYQFIKHAFGLGYSNSTGEPIGLRIYLDNLPDTREKRARFKAFLVALNKSSLFMNARIVVRPDQIAEVDSHHHVVLQCLDIVLGAMFFRLNDLHKAKPEGERCRARRTIAKDELYRAINRHIRSIYPGFNIGITTGERKDARNRWLDPYRHWQFTPATYELDSARTKRAK